MAQPLRIGEEGFEQIAVCNKGKDAWLFTADGIEPQAGYGGMKATVGQTISPRLIHTGGVPPQVSTAFNDTTPVASNVYSAEVFVPANCTVTGIALMNGSGVNGTIKLGLADSTGKILAVTAAATQAGIDTIQRVPLTAPLAIKGPGTYYVLLYPSTITTKFNSHAYGTFGAAAHTPLTDIVVGTAITPPTTLTPNVGPVATLY